MYIARYRDKAIPEVASSWRAIELIMFDLILTSPIALSVGIRSADKRVFETTRFEFRSHRTNHYLNQKWLVYQRIYASLGLSGLIGYVTDRFYSNVHQTRSVSEQPYVIYLLYFYASYVKFGQSQNEPEMSRYEMSPISSLDIGLNRTIPSHDKWLEISFHEWCTFWQVIKTQDDRMSLGA